MIWKPQPFLFSKMVGWQLLPEQIGLGPITIPEQEKVKVDPTLFERGRLH
jgi:hypothetical protein